MATIPHESDPASPRVRVLAAGPVCLIGIFLGTAALVIPSGGEDSATKVEPIRIAERADSTENEIAVERKLSGRRLMIPVIDGVGIVESGMAQHGGRIVIGVPAPIRERIDVRITATSLDSRSGNESQHSIVREVTEPRCRTKESQLRYHSFRFENMNGDGGVLVSLPTRRKFRFPRFHSFVGEESLGLIEGELLTAGSRSLVYVDLRDRDLPHLEGLGQEIVRLIDEELLTLIESRIWPIEDL
ncbi:MAG: hypothetical protein KDA36_05080, partial [Planctomycetaceae bacterium]|nr:hypothetical protein [Planctomycetaceae bacterium]